MLENYFDSILICSLFFTVAVNTHPKPLCTYAITGKCCIAWYTQYHIQMSLLSILARKNANKHIAWNDDAATATPFKRTEDFERFTSDAPTEKKKKNKLCYRFKRRWKKNWCVAKYIGIWRIRWIDPINLNRKTHRRSTFSVAVPCGNMCDKNQRMLWKIYNLNQFVPSATFSGPDSPFSFDFVYST